MELAVILAGGLQDWIDFGVIIAILLLNAVVGWYQEKQAADVVASLKGDIALRATVVRDGQEQEIKARELVPGDIVSHLTQPVIFERVLIIYRSSLRMVKLYQLMPDLSVITITQMDTKSTSANSKLKMVKLVTIGPRTRMMMRDTRSMVPATLFLPSINLP